MFKYEKKQEALLTRKEFIVRLGKHVWVAFLFLLVSLLMGMIGYCYVCELEISASFYNASMILAGMGPAITAPSDSCMWFSGIFAIYSGITFLAGTTIIIAPVIHRILHIVNLDENA